MQTNKACFMQIEKPNSITKSMIHYPFLRLILAASLALIVMPIHAGHYKNFKVSTYIRAQDVAYDNKTLVVENFNDDPVNVRIVVNAKASCLQDLLTGEMIKPAKVTVGNHRFAPYTPEQTVFDVNLAAHSYVGVKIKNE